MKAFSNVQDFNIEKENDDGQTVFQLAQTNHNEAINKFLQDYKAKWDQLLKACEDDGADEILESLRNTSTIMTMTDDERNNLANLSCQKNYVNVLKNLLRFE